MQRYVANGLLVSYNDLPSRKDTDQYCVTAMRHAAVLSQADPKNICSASFLLPILPLSDDPADNPADNSAYGSDFAAASIHRICLWSWCALHNIGKDRLAKLRAIAPGGVLPDHGLVGNTNRNKKFEETFREIDKQLIWYRDNCSSKYATRIVRDESGISSTRDDNDFDYLPPSFSMRQAWIDFCHTMGWVVTKKCKNKQKIHSVDDWELAEGYCRWESDIMPEGMKVAKPIVAWPTYHAYWKKNFPKLKARKSGEDTCDECHSIMCKLRHLRKKKGELEAKAAKAAEDATEALKSILDIEDEVDVDDSDDNGTNPLELIAAINDIQKIIDEAKEHVQMHEAQRELAEKLIALAKAEAHLPMHERTFVITMDMGQNGAVPLLRSEQMGCFYYMSPLTQLIDGKVDASTGKMNAYIWREGSADRGCDNIVSTLHWDLERHGIIGNKVKKLVIIADNCTGQNKNRTVLKYLIWLHEVGCADEVELIFLVKGHTKNDADKGFNILKKGTKGENIWTEDQLDKAFTKNNQDMIDLQRVPAERWKAFTDWLDTMYMDPADISANHVFSIGTSATPTTYARQLYRDADPVAQDLKPSSRSQRASKDLTPEQRAAKVKNMDSELATIPPPGIKPIKKKELYNKIRPIAPPEHQSFYDQFKPTKEDEVINKKRDADKAQAQKDKRNAKKAKIESSKKAASVCDEEMPNSSAVDGDGTNEASDEAALI